MISFCRRKRKVENFMIQQRQLLSASTAPIFASLSNLQPPLYIKLWYVFQVFLLFSFFRFFGVCMQLLTTCTSSWISLAARATTSLVPSSISSPPVLAILLLVSKRHRLSHKAIYRHAIPHRTRCFICRPIC